MAKKMLAVIDATTGTVLSPDNLFAVLGTNEELDSISNSDSDAHDYAMKNGKRISDELLRALLVTRQTGRVEAIASALRWDVEEDNDTQQVIYTGVYRIQPQE